MPVQPPNRPNFLVVLADQLTAALLPAVLGGRDPSPVIAPNLTDLARQGVVFGNAYTNSPLCGPSRAAFMSGLLPTISGVYDNACEWHAGTPTFGHRLRLAGTAPFFRARCILLGRTSCTGLRSA
ncbi:sulfatase-like hydrolase/transferase [Komagataeibacter nataicola]|uniref:sulfatase-like hydrolase/transferase n=1 Tax=Komagataeibacter nataicola TaxID=265960 RepID=UPI0028AC0B7D|nr:sulfatase-like hydrolase/transferase [Komagataeibacter nataicola]WNM08655.1 sulfatase-like hydrolase/transferase [Komagataeibacter nataicola]